MEAAIYGARYGMETVVLEKKYAGGQIASTHMLENYLGFPDGVSGADFAAAIKTQAEKLGAAVESADVTAVRREGGLFVANTAEGECYEAHAVILAAGAYPKRLGIPGEEELIGSGVSFCATCDGAFFKGRDVCVIGGGDTALEDALFLADLANRVYLVHRRNEFRGSAMLVDRVRERENIETVLGYVPVEIKGAEEFAVTGVEVRSRETLEKRVLAVDGCFVAVGYLPDTAVAAGLAELDEAGYVVADETTRTKTEGFFAAGDARKKELRQVVTAAADGAVAAFNAYRHVRGIEAG